MLKSFDVPHPLVRGSLGCAWLLLVALAFTAGRTEAQSFVPSDWSLIAHYPLHVSADDTTGNYGPMQLKNAPFENGGIFLNGIGTEHLELDFSVAETPEIAALNFDAFAMSTEFNTDSLHGNPVLVGGLLWRWAGIWIRDDSLMNLRLNNKQDAYLSPLKWSPGMWHETGILVDSDSVSLYLDGQLGVRVAAELVTGDDRTIGYADGGLGTIFYGTVRNLKVYSKVATGTAVEGSDELPHERMLEEVYPNPVTGQEPLSIVSNRVGVVGISVFDILGREVWKVGDLLLTQGANKLPAMPDGLQNGLYILRVEAGDHAETRSVIVAR